MVKWPLSLTIGEGEAAEVVEEEEIVGEGVKEEEIKEIKVVKEKKVRSIQGIRQPDMLTNLHIRPVDAIGALGSQLISVKNQGLVHGRTSGSLSPINEIQASPHQ